MHLLLVKNKGPELMDCDTKATGSHPTMATLFMTNMASRIPLQACGYAMVHHVPRRYWFGASGMVHHPVI